MSRLVGYVRVSTREQAEEGASLIAQEEKVTQYAALHGHELVKILSDTATGKTTDRPGLQTALTMLREGQAEGIIVLKLDRLTRSRKDCETLMQEYFQDKFALHSIQENLDTSSAMGRFFVSMVASLAQLERETIGERTKDVLQAKKRRGERVGSVPYGYRLAEDERRLKECVKEQEVIMRTRALREKGLNWSAIARRLADRGMLSRAGKMFQTTQLIRFAAA